MSILNIDDLNQAANSSVKTTQEKFDALRNRVFEKKPVLRDIVEKHGHKVLYDYARDYAQVNLNPPIQNRQNELISAIQRLVEKRLGADIAADVAAQLQKYYFVSTTDHHGPICHPFFLNGNFISSATCFETPDPLLKNIIVLSCANVSLNNSSFPRGLLFHTAQGDQQELQRLSFFTASDRLCSVYGYRPYTQADLKRSEKDITKKINQGNLDPVIGEKLMGIIREVYGSEAALAASSFSEQVTSTNLALWEKFFAINHINAPRLIYLDQEEVVAELLASHHLNNQTVIGNILFNPDFEPLIHKYFQGIRGAFDTTDQTGTYFFWAVPKGQKYRQQLWKQGNKLVTKDGSYSVELTPEAIAAGLRSKELIPSMLLTFMVLAFYYGLKCLGGFSQVNYLTFMKQAYLKMLTDLGNYKDIEVCARVQTKELCGEVTLAFLRGNQGLIPATGLDLVLYGNEMTWSEFVKLSKNITLAEALNPLMGEFYKITFSEVDRDPELAGLSSQDITTLTGLDKKITPCASL